MKTYKDIPYIVHLAPHIGHYCAYVRLPDDYEGKEALEKTREIYGRKHFVWYDDINIECHGGLTFWQKMEKGNDFPQWFTEWYWVGWDYGHYGDAMTIWDHTYEWRYWTEEAVENECKQVIDKIVQQNII